MAFQKSGVFKKQRFPKSSARALRVPAGPVERLAGRAGLGWGQARHELSLSLLSPFHTGLSPLQQPQGMGP